MYGDLRSKLEMYKNKQTAKPEKVIRRGLDIHDLLEGTICENEAGKCFVVEKRYPLLHKRGGYDLGYLLEIDLQFLTYIFHDIGENLSIRDLIFLDTETTGLSGGAGTVAFLIGTGFYDNDCFVIRQYFMRDYNEEPAVLSALNQLLTKFKGLVTFNGKAFDWNLLCSRFISNRIRIAMREPMHLDLLFPSRKIWKLKLESCRLANLEENILNEYRSGDIPGAMIPSIYFKYLEDRDATEIRQVITHNELDILTMPSLMAKMHTLLENPLSETDGDKELLGIGKIFESAERYETMVDCYNNCIQSDNGFVKETAARRLANAYKRKQDYENAVKQWQDMVADNNISIYPLIELAKYYEHKSKDIKKALEMVEKALAIVSNMGIYNKISYTEVKKRYERLKRKVGKINA